MKNILIKLFALLAFNHISISFVYSQNKTELQVKKGFTVPIDGMMFSNDSSKLFTWGLSNEVKVYEVKSGKLIKTLNDFENIILAVCLNPTNSEIIIVDMDGKFVCYDEKLNITNVYYSDLKQKIFNSVSKLDFYAPEELDLHKMTNYKTLSLLMYRLNKFSFYNSETNKLNIFLAENDNCILLTTELKVQKSKLTTQVESRVKKIDAIFREFICTNVFPTVDEEFIMSEYKHHWTQITEAFSWQYVFDEHTILHSQQQYWNYFLLEPMLNNGAKIYDLNELNPDYVFPEHIANLYLSQNGITVTDINEDGVITKIDSISVIMLEITSSYKKGLKIPASLEKVPKYSVEADRSLGSPFLAAYSDSAVYHINMTNLSVKRIHSLDCFEAQTKLYLDSTGRYIRYSTCSYDRQKEDLLKNDNYWGGNIGAVEDDSTGIDTEFEPRPAFIPSYHETYGREWGVYLLWDTQTNEILYSEVPNVKRGDRYLNIAPNVYEKLIKESGTQFGYGNSFLRDTNSNYDLLFESKTFEHEDLDLYHNFVAINRVFETSVFNKEDELIKTIVSSNLVKSIGFIRETNLIFISTVDGLISLYDVLSTSNEPVVTMIFNNDGYLFYTPDNYYTTNSSFGDNLFFYHDGKQYPYEQFDLKYNRPDLVLTEIGCKDSTLIQSYKKAYLNRLKKMGFTEDMLKDDIHLPEIKIENFESFPNITNQSAIDLNLNLEDTKYNLDRVNVWINDVAIYGTDGITLRELNLKSYQTKITVPLAFGNNKIQFSVLNLAGAESYKETINIQSTTGKQTPDLYILTLGVSNYLDDRFNLSYASKDALDMVEAFNKSTFYTNVYSKTLTNQDVLIENVKLLKSFFEKADINDHVIIFIAGHGVLDVNFDYYFASYDMDFSNPSSKGIPYEMIEELLNGIKPLKKLLFMDTCHSGEVDKEELVIAENTVSNEENDIVFRNVGTGVIQKENAFGLTNTSELTRSLFTDLRKGTGATVISSSGGAEFSMESEKWQNGLFTFCLIDGLINKKADANLDEIIMVSELQNYVQNQVNILSNGRQTPTSRIRNHSLDYRVW